jgi:hypothetical protein
MAFFAQTSACFCKNLITTLLFEKKTLIFFAENWQKSQKIVIITLAPTNGQICIVETEAKRIQKN